MRIPRVPTATTGETSHDWRTSSSSSIRRTSSASTRTSLLAGQDLMPDQHTHSARPTVLAAGEVRFLLIDDLAGTRVADADRNVIVGLGDLGHHADQRLGGPELKCDRCLATLAVAQRPLPHRRGVGVTDVDEAVASGLCQLAPCRVRHLFHDGGTRGALAEQRRRGTRILQLESEYRDLDGGSLAGAGAAAPASASTPRTTIAATPRCFMDIPISPVPLARRAGWPRDCVRRRSRWLPRTTR